MPQNTQPQGLDQDAINLSKAIRQTESGGNFNAKGKTGERGAYQFMPATWANYSKQAGVSVPLEQATPEQQNEVAYKKIKQWKDQGYNPGQIASMWNAGEGKPNAYIEGNKGTNSKGVAYDTAKYAKDVATAYQQFKTTPGSQFAGSGANVAQAAGGDTPPDTRNFFQKAADFAFPIAGDIGALAQGKNEKNPGQLVGDAALSALWFVPGLGQGAGLATRVAGGLIGKTAAKVAGRAAEGALTGYGADVATNLQQGKDLGSSLKPGLGTVTGGFGGPLLGAVGDRLAGQFTKRGAIQKLEDNLRSNIMATKPGTRMLQEAGSVGFAPEKLIARAPEMVPDVVEGSFLTTAQQKVAKQRIAQLGQARAEALDALGPAANQKLDILEAEAIAKAQPTREMLAGMTPMERKVAMKTMSTSDVVKTVNKIKAEFDHLRSVYGDEISPSILETIKEANAEASGIYKRTGVIGDANAHSIIGNVAKNKIEQISEASGLPGMKEYNKYMASHYNVLDILKHLNGQKVKGGRLGNMLRSHAMGTAASIAGGMGGGGFLGAMMGFGGGELAGGLLGKIMGQTSLTNPLRDAILKRIQAENPAVVQELLDFAKQGGKKVAPILYPGKSGGRGLVSRTLNQTASRLATQPTQ